MSSTELRRYPSTCTDLPPAKRLGSEKSGFSPTLKKPYSFLHSRLVVKWAGASNGSADSEIYAIHAVNGGLGRRIATPTARFLATFCKMYRSTISDVQPP